MASESKGAPAQTAEEFYTRILRRGEVNDFLSYELADDPPPDYQRERIFQFAETYAAYRMEIIAAHCQAPAPAPEKVVVNHCLIHVWQDEETKMWIAEFLACMTSAPTKDEAIKRLQEVAALQAKMFAGEIGPFVAATPQGTPPTPELPDRCPTCGSTLKHVHLCRFRHADGTSEVHAECESCTNSWHSSAATQKEK